MLDNDDQMIKIGNVTPPQFKNRQTGKWELISGEDGGYLVKSPKMVASKPFNGTATTTKEFPRAMSAFVISNDGIANLTITINDGDAAGDTYTVYAGAVWDEVLPPFTSITINTSVAFQAYGRYEMGSTDTIPTPDTTAPDNVTGVTASAITSSTLLLSWNASASSDCDGYEIYRGSTKIATVSGLTYNVTGLSPNTQYTLTVKAKDGAGNVASGSGASVTITTPADADTTPPDDVTNLTKSNITASGVTLSWTAPVGGSSYDIYNGATFVANVQTTNYNVTGLSALTAYTFTVKAKDAVGNAAAGAQIQVTTIAAPDTTAPTNVASVSTSNLLQTTVTLSWPASVSSDVAGYDIYNGSTFVTSVTGLTYNVTGLTALTQYTFWVKAKDAVPNIATGTSVTFTTAAAADTTPPAAVTALTAGTPTTSSVPLTWTLSSSGDVATQEVAYSSNGGSSYTVASAIINAGSNSYTVNGLAANTAYTFRVVAVDGAGNRSNPTTTTKTTAATADTTPPDAPASITAGTPTASTIPVSWPASAASDLDHYELSYSTDGTNFTVASPAVTGTSYTFTGLTASALHTLKVAAIDTSNNRSTGNPTTTATTAAAAEVILYSDDFNRTDSSSLGNTAVGNKPWSGSYQIISGQAGTTTPLTSVPSWATFDAGTLDNIEIIVELTAPSSFTTITSGVVFRYSGTSSVYVFGPFNQNTVGVYKGGGTATLPANVTISTVGTHTYAVRLTGSTVNCYMDGNLIMTFTDTSFAANTKHGFQMYSITTLKVDNIKIKQI